MDNSRLSVPALLMLVVSLVLIALSAGCTSQSTPHTTTPPGYLACIYLAYGCTGTTNGLQIKPKEMQLSGDATLFVNEIRWHGWGTTMATGRGTAKADDCDPNCATGKFHYYPAVIVLSKPLSWHGKRAYSYAAESVPAIHWREINKDLLGPAR